MDVPPRSSNGRPAACRMPRFATVCCSLLLAIASPPASEAASKAVPPDRLAEHFAVPPDSARPWVRWWWFGNAVQADELRREIGAMHEGGFGGFEVQPVYPLSLDDLPRDIRNQRYLSMPFLDALHTAASVAHQQGLGYSVTLGSGWPFGGPHTQIDEASASVQMTRIEVAAQASRARLPALAAGESWLAMFIVPETPNTDPAGPASFQRLKLPAGRGEQIDLQSSSQRRTLLAFRMSRTGQQVKRAGIGGEGFVLDHFNRRAVQDHLSAVGDPLLAALGDLPPDSVFSDSLEVYGADWTQDLPEQFLRRRGYDLLDHLPALFLGDARTTAGLRHDWGQTLTELVNERYLDTVRQWAHQHGTLFRSQTYGFPSVDLSSSDRADVIEGEDNHWRRFSTLRWASSASHLYGHPITSVEAWTWLHSPPFAASPLDMKVEADRLFLQGANAFVAHGWPYSPPGVAEPGWTFYAAGAFNDHNPWWNAMPAVTTYVQRLSGLLRQGAPVNDVAIYVPTDDAWSRTRPGHASVSAEVGYQITPSLTTQLLDAGYGFDYVDDAALAGEGLYRRGYRVLVLPDVQTISPDAYARIAAFAADGGAIAAVDHPPQQAAGWKATTADDNRVHALDERIFGSGSHRAAVVAVGELGKALQGWLRPDLSVDPGQVMPGFVHRRIDARDVYFVVNFEPQPFDAEIHFRDDDQGARQAWSTEDGQRCELAQTVPHVHLAPYQSRIFVFGSDLPPAPACRQEPAQVLATLAAPWQRRLGAAGTAQSVTLPDDWARQADSRHFSGIGDYEYSLSVALSWLDGAPLWLDFGQGQALPHDSHQRGIRAWISMPVNVAARVYINGRAAGTLWAPPWRLRIDGLLHAGNNRIEVRVGNLALNALSDMPAPDDRLLEARYGQRFEAQDRDRIQPQAAGLDGPVTLLRQASDESPIGDESH